MQVEEFMAIAKGLRATYANRNFLKEDDGLMVWFNLLKDLPYADVAVAAQKIMLTSKFPPTVAEIREAVASLHSTQKDWGDAWGDVVKAIARYGYPREQEALASMDDVTRRTVERIGWQNLCMSENPQVDRANFRMIYENAAQQKHEQSMLPQKLSERIENMRNVNEIEQEVNRLLCESK